MQLKRIKFEPSVQNLEKTGQEQFGRCLANKNPGEADFFRKTIWSLEKTSSTNQFRNRAEPVFAFRVGFNSISMGTCLIS